MALTGQLSWLVEQGGCQVGSIIPITSLNTVITWAADGAPDICLLIFQGYFTFIAHHSLFSMLLMCTCTLDEPTGPTVSVRLQLTTAPESFA